MSYSLHKKKAGPSKQTDDPQRDDHAGDGPKPEAPSTSALPLYAGEQPVLRLSAENQATTKPPAGLPVNPPDNDLEQDADRVADQVMRTPGPSLQRACACGGGGCSECQGEQQAGQAQESVQTKSIQSVDAGQGQAAPPIVGEVLSAPGRALDSETRAFMEPRFGRNFGDVRTHTDKKAAESARAVEARAYTVGSDIAFGGDGFVPHTSAGRHLLAHELAHVVQQGKAGGPGHDASDGAQVMRDPVAKKTVVRKNATELFGSAGPPATTGITVEEFESYTRAQADWFAEPTLSAADRDFLWELLLRVTANPHLLAGVGDLKLTTARGVPAADWPPLDAFSRAADSTKQTVRVLSATAYTLPQRVTFGQTLVEVEKLIPPDVLELTVSELQLMEINTLSLLPMLDFYWKLFQPHVQMTYVPAPGERARVSAGARSTQRVGNLPLPLADRHRPQPAPLQLEHAHPPRHELEHHRPEEAGSSGDPHGARREGVPAEHAFIRRPRPQLAQPHPDARRAGLARGHHHEDSGHRQDVRTARRDGHPTSGAGDDCGPRRVSVRRVGGHRGSESHRRYGALPERES
jgi:hypothetical protein